MSARTELADALAAELASRKETKPWRVIPSGVAPGNTSRPFLLVRQDGVTRNEAMPRRYRDHSMLLTLAVPNTDPDRLEDVLEECLDELLDALDRLQKPFPGLTWSGASRVMLEDYHAWDVNAAYTTEPA